MNIIRILLLLFGLLFFKSCNNTDVCKEKKIVIENKWFEENGGLQNIIVSNQEDIKFICARIHNFEQGERVRIAYSYGYIEIILNKVKTVQAIFTYNNGVVYRVSPGKYIYDEELTKRILKLLRIKNRCWGQNCD